MAKITGTQNVPSALLDVYRGTLGEATPKASVAKRYPYRVPPMQTEAGHPSVKQLAQRTRFTTIFGKFATLSPSERARWHDNMPEWGSLLWYYNYFMLSGLSGNADPEHGGAGLIKSIKHYTFTMPTGAPSNINVTIDTIDPTKAVVFFYGAGVNEISQDIGAIVYPYLVSLAATLAVVKASHNNDIVAGCSLTIIEYI